VVGRSKRPSRRPRLFVEACGLCGSGWIDLPSLHVNDMPAPSNHVELALYADDTAIVATSRKPMMLVGYLKLLQRWLSEWRIAINASKSSAILFARAGRHFIQSRPITLFGEPIQWVETTRYLGVTLDKRLTWSPHIDQARKKTAKGWACWVLS
jgi:hypothetical protein